MCRGRFPPIVQSKDLGKGRIRTQVKKEYGTPILGKAREVDGQIENDENRRGSREYGVRAMATAESTVRVQKGTTIGGMCGV